MTKKHLLSAFCGALALSAVSAWASDSAQGYIRFAEQGVSVGLNPAGSFVFGYNGRSGDESQLTWLFDVQNKTTCQYPSDDVPEWNAMGQLMDLSDSGIGVGTFRDNDWATTVINGLNETEENYPLNSACMWVDGERIVLDHNKWTDADDFKSSVDGTLPNPGNGFYAMRISPDGSKIVGYLKAFTYMLPVRWDRQADGTYVSTMMDRNKGEFFYLWVGASADGHRVIMNTSQSGGQSYIWNGDDAHVIFNYSEPDSKITGAYLTAMSPDGNSAIMSCERDGKQAYGVYSFLTGDVTWIAVPEGAASTNWFAANVLTNRGDGFICDYNYQLHYFNTQLGLNIPFSAYLQAYGSDITNEVVKLPTKALVRMVSTDGMTICGNNLSAGVENQGWILRLPEKAPKLYSLHNCEALSTSPSTVMIKWQLNNLPEDLTMKHYMLETDGQEQQMVDATLGEDGYYRATVDCGVGSHEFNFWGVAEDADGKEWNSVKQNLSVDMSATTELYFFEDLTDSKMDETVMSYIYDHDTFTPAQAHDSGVLNFRLDAGDFYNLTPFWYTCGFSTAPWDTYLESRWFDARTTTEGFYFTWQERNMTINDETVYHASNLLKVEYTLDGENWVELHETNGKINSAHWNARVVDLSDLAGKMFRLRFHAHGAGKYACEWRVDYYGIQSAEVMYDAPQGLMVTKSDASGNTLAWKNNRGEYEVSHNFNSPMTFNNNVGNAGKPLYVACDYGPEKLKPFEGKFITGVATMIYEPEEVGQEEHTKVEAVIFDEDGKEISRGELGKDAPWYEPLVSTSMPIHHIELDTPVLIEPGKTYRVSILISEYEPEMNPIWYFSASDDYIPYVTDLYSDNNLESWESLSSYFRQECSTDEEFNKYGRCIFNIRPCITDTEDTAFENYNQEQWFYQVYRNGELLPSGIAYFTQQSVLDSKGGDANYSVRSFRRDGAVSQMSETLNFEVSGVQSLVADGAETAVLTREGDQLIISGEFDSVALYSLPGVKIADSRVVNLAGLPRGVYVVVITRDGRTTSHKIAL